MKVERELILFENKDCESTLDEMLSMAKERGFTRGNSLKVTVHCLPNTAPTVEQLAVQINDFLAAGRFEYIFKGEYKEKACESKKFKEDVSSTTHIHYLIKGRYCELKPFLIEWNKHTPKFSNPLMHATPIDGSVKDSLNYLFKELQHLDGFKAAEFGACFKSKRIENNNIVSRWLNALGALWKKYVFRMRLINSKLYLIRDFLLSTLFNAQTLIDMRAMTSMFFNILPNPPPSNYSDLFGYNDMNQNTDSVNVKLLYQLIPLVRKLKTILHSRQPNRHKVFELKSAFLNSEEQLNKDILMWLSKNIFAEQNIRKIRHPFTVVKVGELPVRIICLN